ncbi:MAG: hypothetical protein IPN19_03980 [Elusimicrobia bacterium]|nr:hypothetical protein [Elusimicrobiota bacterium]
MKLRWILSRRTTSAHRFGQGTKPTDGYFVARGRYVPGSGLREIPALNERPPRRIKRAATPASDSDVSRSGLREKPRGLFGRAPLGSGGIFPAGPLPFIAPVGERKPTDGYFVGRKRYVHSSGLWEIIAPDERPSRRMVSGRASSNQPFGPGACSARANRVPPASTARH